MAIPWHNKCGPLKSSQCSMAMKCCCILNKPLSPITVMMTSQFELNILVLHDRRNIKFWFGPMGNRIKKDFGLNQVPSALVLKKPREMQLDGIGKPKVLCHSTCDVIKMNSCSNMLVLSIGLYISTQSLTILIPYSQIKDNKKNILKS